jgi:hypothetical protein
MGRSEQTQAKTNKGPEQRPAGTSPYSSRLLIKMVSELLPIDAEADRGLCLCHPNNVLGR